MKYFRYYKNDVTRLRLEQRAGFVSKPVVRDHNDYVYRLYDLRGTPEPPPPLGYTSGRAYHLGAQNTGLSGPAYAAAYDKFWKTASGGSRAALGITLLEYKSSLGMIAQAAGSIAKSAGALRRGDVYNCIRLLGVRAPKSVSRRVKDKYDRGWRLDNLWLELNFGWAPLYQDIYNAVQVMGQEIPTQKIRAHGRETLDFNESFSGSDWYTKSYGLGYRRVELSGNISAVNPNVLLLKQLGLTNPAQVVWDAIPFSFALDWVLPVNKFLSSLDVELGLTVANLSASTKTYVEGGDLRYYAPDPAYNFSWTSKFIDFQRRALSGTPLPSFASRLPDLSWNLWRSTTSVALAYQQLSTLRFPKRDLTYTE